MFSFGGGTSKKSSSATNEDVALVHALLVMGLQDAVRRIIQASLSARERRIRGEYARGEEELVDSMTEVEALLEVLELCLWHGLREPQRRSHGRSHGRHDKTQAGVGTSSTAESSHFWDFVLLLERVDPTAFGGTIMLVRANSGCSTNQGLCRAWIRMLLNQNALEYTIRALCRLATTSGRDFYEDWAFLRWSAETNRTMFFTLLGVLNNVGFALNTKNRGLDRPSPVGPGDMLSHDALKCCLAFESALAAACAANPNDPPTVLVASSVDSEVTGRFVYLQPGLFSNRNTGYQLRVVDAKRGTSPRQWGLFAPAQDQPRYLANAKSVSDPPLQDWAPSDEVAAEFNKPPQAVKMLHSQSVRARLYPGSHKIKWGTLLRSEIQAIRVEIKQVEHLRKRLDAVRKIECPMGEDEEDLPLVQPLETVVEEISQSDSPPDSDSGAHVRATETTPNESPMVDPLASGVDRENFAPHADAQDQTEDELNLRMKRPEITELSDDDMSIVQDAEILSNTSKEETVSSGNAAPDAVKSMKKDAVSESETLVAENQDSVALVEKDGANEDSQKADSSDDMSIVQDAEILSNTSKEETVSSGNAAPDAVKSMKKDAVSESETLLAENQDSVALVEKDGANEDSQKADSSDDMSIVQDAEILSNTSKEETVSSGNAAPDDVKSMQKDADSESGTSLAEKRVSDVPRMKKSLNPFEDESVDSSGEDESEIAESDAIESSDTDRMTVQDTETLSNKINDDVAMSTRAAFDDRDDANSKAKVPEAGVTNESKSEGDAIDNSIEDTGDALDLHVAEGHHAGATIKSLDTIKTNDRYQQESFSEVSSNNEASTAEVSSSQSSEADSLSIDAELTSEVEAAKHSKSKGKGRKGPRRVQMASIEDTDLAQDPLQALEPAPSSRGSRRISRPTVVHASKIAEAGELAKSSSAIQFNSALLSAANNFVVMQDDDEDDDVESVEIHGHTSCDEDSLETGAAGEVDRETDGSRARDLSAPTAPSGESEEERLARYAREEEESLAAFIAEQNTEKANSVSSKRELASHASRKDEPPANVSIVPTSEFIDLVRAYVRLDPQKAAARTLASKIHGSTGYEIGPMLSPSQDMDPDADEVTKANSEAPVAASSKFSLAVFSGRLSLWGSGTDAEQENDSGSRSGANAASSALETGAGNRETSDLAHETDSEIDIDLASDANVTRVESASVVGQYISKRASDMHVRYIIRVQLRKIARAGNDDLEEWISSENDASILQERTEVDTEEASSHVAARTATYTVHRRFRDFKQLRAALFNAAAASSDQDSKDTFPTLPKTAWTRSFSEDYIARKRIGLDDFLQEILRLRLEGASAREHPVVIDFLTQGMCVPWEEDEEERGPDFPLDSPSLNRRGSGLRRKGSRGLHVALITDPRGDPQVMEERDSIGLAEQDFRCISCGRDISIALGESKGLWGASREPSRRSARFCHYTEGWFCPWCFSCGSAGGQEQEREFEYYNESDTGLDWDEASSTSRLAPLQEHNRVLPTRVLHHWDFEPLAVSADAASFLDSISQHPVLCVSAESPRLFSQVKELQHARLLRLQLVFARETLARCVENENSLEGVAPALRSREHLAQETEMYSMNDLFELHLGTLIPLLMRAVDQVSDHITKSCEHCRSTAQTCAVCNKKDDPLFAFDIDKVVLCRGCQGAFHRECFVSIGGEEFCPICKKSALNS
ncbi:Differentially expressed in FDCP 8-like [Hondaea fermentalgiana]|uniref:Differentially expressed in FDCP 8-like n=1 Tax=Hondaea fermentalgiana TaxID=2315210 RepID=A0A2R5GMF5_9STRA|nr:Differentially expressed in FDCP 8-like [Hondaea fermentalgiana]|eukprot:GBG32067.1 Differentially expressed in FDCP 8-like [Hondaea fermentalgiana]